MTFLSSALAYASKFSIHVFPLGQRAKVPLGRLAPNGFLSATVDAGIIRNWWTKAPDANIGIACAPSGLVVIDVDPRNGGDETFGKLQNELGPVPQTWTVLTPGVGQHYYYRDQVGEYAGTLGPGVDIKYQGYVVAPPSYIVTRDYSGEYRWDVGSHPSESQVAELPNAWLARMTSRRVAPSLPSSGEDARASFLGAAFEHMGWLGPLIADGKRMVRCPWLEEHTDKRGDSRDSSTVIFPRAVGRTMGGFRCAHAHCANRTYKDVLRFFPSNVHYAAKRVTQELQPRSIWGDKAG
jgi:hypothetical protein